jgi:hypothetical protein
MTPAIILRGVVDTCEQLLAGFVDTGDEHNVANFFTANLCEIFKLPHCGEPHLCGQLPKQRTSNQGPGETDS